MIKKTHYTIGEAAAILGITEETLNRWRLRWHVPATKSDVDLRLSLVAREGIELLGHKKDRTPNWAILELPGKPKGTRRTPSLAAAIQSLTQQQAWIQTQLAELAARDAEAEAHPAHDSTQPYTRHEPPRFADAPILRAMGQQTHVPGLVPIPAGWVAWQRLARAHGIPKSTCERARDHGDFPVQRIERGSWQQDDGSHCVEAVTPEGQQLFHAWAASRKQFVPVPHCALCRDVAPSAAAGPDDGRGAPDASADRATSPTGVPRG